MPQHTPEQAEAPPGSGPHETAALRRENAQFRRAVDELALLNEVATALGQAPDLEAMLHQITQRAIQAVGAAQGTVTLVDAADAYAPDTARTAVRTAVGTSTQAAFRPGDVLLGWMHRYRHPLRLHEPRTDARFHPSDWDPAIRSVLCVPMLVRASLVGVLTVYNKHMGALDAASPEQVPAPGFSEDDTRLLAILAAQSAQIVEHTRVREERDRVRRIFGQHTDPAVVDTLLHGQGDLTPRRQRVCVMFLDLRGFTTFAEQAAPEAVMDRLNGLFWFMIEEVNRHQGVLHQLLGDGFMALFGVPEPTGADSENAVRAALAITTRLDAAVAAGAVPPTRLGIGIHVGEAVTGLVGSRLHREYKVTGDTVNLAARIEGLNKEWDSTILISEAVWAEVQSYLGDEVATAAQLGPVPVRGRSQPVGLVQLR